MAQVDVIIVLVAGVDDDAARQRDSLAVEFLFLAAQITAYQFMDDIVCAIGGGLKRIVRRQDMPTVGY